MFKQLAVTFSAFGILLSSPAQAIAPQREVIAIAPGVKQIGACGNFTANKYKVAPNQVTVKVYRQTARGFYLDWQVSRFGASGYCFVSNNVITTEWKVERGPRPEQVASLGPNEKMFYGLPGYGNVVVNRGQGATGDKQYFLVRPVSTGRNLRWYARCANNSDQVYDHTGKYVGYNKPLTVMFPYVCEVSPLSNRPTPQPR